MNKKQVKVVINLKRLSPHSTGELCAVKVARTVRRRQGTCECLTLSYLNFANFGAELMLALQSIGLVLSSARGHHIHDNVSALGIYMRVIFKIFVSAI